jgi:hypothetical protein
LGKFIKRLFPTGQIVHCGPPENRDIVTRCSLGHLFFLTATNAF